MYSYKINKLPKSTVEIIFTLPKSDIAKEEELAFKRLQDILEVQGFRKGKAPKDIAKNHLKTEEIYQEMLKVILPKYYEEVIKKEGLKPIVNPKIDLTSAKPKEDWVIKMTLAEKPIIKLNDYKKAIKDIKSDQKKDEIWVPGKDKTPENDQKTLEAKKTQLFNQILENILKNSQVDLSEMIIEDELNHRLSRLVDDIQKIGITVDAYLKSKNLTMDSLKARYKQEIEDTYKLEFILSEIADKENIKVEESDINKMLDSIKDIKEKEMAKKNAYYYANFIRKQKTLDFLTSL